MRGYLTSVSTPIKNGALISELLDPVYLPRQIEVVKCKADTNRTDKIGVLWWLWVCIAKRNTRADRAAREAAKAQSAAKHIWLAKEVKATPSPEYVVALKHTLGEEEKNKWKKLECIFDENYKTWALQKGRNSGPKSIATIACSFYTQKWPCKQERDARDSV